MDIIRIAVAGIICAVLAISLKKHSPEFAILISLSASLFIFFLLLPRLSEAVTALKELSSKVSTDSSYITIVLKIIGIAYIAEFGTQICIDAGESGIGSKVELSGKILIMATSIPVLMGLLDLINKIMP